MKVSELQKGMVLQIVSESRCGYLTDDRLLPCGEPEFRIGYSAMASMFSTPISRDALIIYLGHDRLPTDSKDPHYRQLVRRVVVDGKTAVILGHNFKHIEPHPKVVCD